jgi:uncharacterized protein (TIGR03083 family)
MGIDFATCIAEESALFRACALGNLDVPVPTCGTWNMRTLIEHVAFVFTERSACIHAGSDVEEFARVQPTLVLPAEDSIAAFDIALAGMLSDFRAHRDSDPAVTWSGLENTVGFWKRRMAHEVLTHRIDAELALGRPVGPVADALAADGVDEYIDTKLIYKSAAQNEECRDSLRSLAGTDVRFVYGEHQRVVSVDTDAITPGPGGSGPQLTLSASPLRLNLWLWRRVDFDAVAIDGDEALAREFYHLVEFIGQ